jgi:hypothetical protein
MQSNTKAGIILMCVPLALAFRTSWQPTQKDLLLLAQCLFTPVILGLAGYQLIWCAAHVGDPYES